MKPFVVTRDSLCVVLCCVAFVCVVVLENAGELDKAHGQATREERNNSSKNSGTAT